MVFRLDAVDAYERKLVKQIEVASMTVDGAYNKPYVRILAVSNKRGVISAKVELDVQMTTGVRRMEKIVQDGDDLEQVTERALYKDIRIGEIRTARNDELVEIRVPGGEHWLRPGQAIGDVDADALKRLMIRRTIKEHLDKEKRLAPITIKVLSLFFIDEVANYRSYDKDGKPVKGKYALMFEEEYRRLAKHPDYQVLFKEVDVESDATEVHNGYFSIDKKICTPFEDRELKKSASKEAVETDTYSLIMRDKEKLLSFDTKLKFIFSHSALREGWDNPNVFQICALREIGTERERRQSIGRGLRLCVNQQGERLRGFEINTLTVIANEGFEEFAAKLQKEIEDETGIRFGIVEEHQFAGVAVTDSNGEARPLGFEESKSLWHHLKAQGYVDAKGKVQDTLRTALKEGKIELPEKFAPQLSQITDILRKLAGRLEIKNADDRVPIKTRQAVLESEGFKALWNRIKHKTTYRVDFDNEKLIVDCAKSLKDGAPIAKTRVQIRKADLAIGKAGVTAKETGAAAPVTLDETDIELPDLLTDLQDKTHLTRRSIVRILKESGRLDDFKRNPQDFIELAAETINRTKRLAIVDGIKYQRIGDEHYYAEELFQTEELRGYLKQSSGGDEERIRAGCLRPFRCRERIC